MAESEEELKSLLMKAKVESEKIQHSENEDHGIWPITSWAIDGETVEIVSFNFMAAVTICSDFGAQKNKV